jgi:iron complex outermembrane receptor protein
VRLLRDGVPITLPDGQTPTDWIDLETIERVDVIRGTAAALYGNASGGVIDLRSREPVATPLGGVVRLWDGGGVRRLHATIDGGRPNASGRGATPRGQLAVTRTAGDGPRQWAGLEATQLFARGLATVGGARVELQGTRYESSRAENTGALTAAELARDPRLPDSLNITKRSRKAATQSQLALVIDRPIGAEGNVRAVAFGGTRTLDNPLPFAVVAVDRAFLGGTVHGSWRTQRFAWPLRLGAGIEGQRLADDRRNYENCADLATTAPLTARCPARTERGALRLDQDERAATVGAFARVEVEAPGALFASAALRGDQIAFAVRDRFVTATNVDDSGDRTLRALSPMVGLAWRARPVLSTFVNLATAFETPTVTELTNQETGAAGLNAALRPQRTRTLEAGVQGLVGGHWRVDLAGFHAQVTDELVPFDIPNQPGRRAFRNAGATRRRGAEVGVRGAWSAVELGSAYTYSAFRFLTYAVGTQSYAGQPIPGVPSHAGQGFLTLRQRGLFGTLEWSGATSATADDAGRVRSAGYAVWNVRGGAHEARLRGVVIEPVVAVENLFDRRYAASLVVNATRGRYFEPGLPRRLTALIRVARN